MAESGNWRVKRALRLGSIVAGAGGDAMLEWKEFQAENVDLVETRGGGDGEVVRLAGERVRYEGRSGGLALVNKTVPGPCY